MDDAEYRSIRSLTIRKVIDESNVEMASDKERFRELRQMDDIRVELTHKNAKDLYERQGADVPELFPQPRVCQEAGSRKFKGETLQPGWSLDLTMNDPVTGSP